MLPRISRCESHAIRQRGKLEVERTASVFFVHFPNTNFAGSPPRENSLARSCGTYLSAPLLGAPRPLAVHAYKRNPTAHNTKYNLPETSEVEIIAINEHCGSIDVKRKRKGYLDKNAYDELININLVYRMCDQSVYPLLLPYGIDGWQSGLTLKKRSKYQE